MSLFAIDRDKCKRDGICVAVCPGGVIEIKEPEAFPSLVEGGEELCINCGHCVAVCPQGAFRLATMKPEDCAPVKKELLPAPEQVEHLLRSRRSVRSYKQKPVPREILGRLIDIARYAPSGHNDQPTRWIVVEDAKELERLKVMTVDWMRSVIKEWPETEVTIILDSFVNSWERGEDRILRGAPHVIIGHASKSALSPQVDCSTALTYLELAAHSLGLGACWAGALQAAAASHPPIVEALQIPEGHQCFGAMMVGYPRHEFRRIPLRNIPQTLWL